MSVLPVSVVMPLYNGAAHVEAALETVAAQDPGPAEVIVIDDGSTDGGADLVGRRKQPRVRLLRQENKGVAEARNAGLAEAQSIFVAFLDADDLWCPGHLARLVTAATAVQHAAVIGERFRAVGGNAKASDALALPALAGEARQADYVTEAAAGDAPFYTSSCMVRREAAIAEGGFPRGESHGEDLALWIRLSEKHGAAATDVVGALYRRSAAGLTGRATNVPDIAMRTLDVLLPEAVPTRREAILRLRTRLALAHALDGLGRGESSRARVALAEAGGEFPLRRAAAHMLAIMPVTFVKAGFALRAKLRDCR